MNRLLTYLLLSVTVLAITSTNEARIIHQEKSLYRNIVVDQTGDLLCLKFTLVRANPLSQSCVDQSAPKELVFNYSKLVMGSLLLNPEPKKILVIGLGGGTIIKTLRELSPDSEITAVEIDPAVIKVARDYFNYTDDDGKTETLAVDGRVFVKRAIIKKQQYDWILLDAFNGDYIPEHLLTKEFLEEVRSIMSDDGVVIANTFSSSRLYDHESATYAAVFDDYYNLKFSDTSNRVIIAKLGEMPEIDTLIGTAFTLQKLLVPYNVNIIDVHRSIQTKPDWDKNAKVLTDQFSPANLLRD